MLKAFLSARKINEERPVQKCGNAAARGSVVDRRAENKAVKLPYVIDELIDLIVIDDTPPKLLTGITASAGSDRKIKFWDLRRPYEPINSIKRFLSTELAWLLPYNGVTVAQDNCYASYGRMERG